MSESSYVVMSNDFPDAVFDTEEAAESYCKKRMDEQKAEIRKKYTGEYQPPARVYYRWHLLETNQEGRPLDLKNMYGTYGL